MKRGRAGEVLFVVAVILVPFYVGDDLPEPLLPVGGVLMSTDKECYCVGEDVNITATGWASVPSIGDFPYVFWAITSESGEAVFETSNLLTAVGAFNGTLNGTWNQTYRFPYGDPPHGEQVPPGTYTIWFYEIPRPNESIPGWIPTEAEIVECGGPVADAGLNQTVYEGDTVQFNGTGSYSQGANVGGWSPRAEVPALTFGIGSATLNGEIYYAGGNTFDPAIYPTSIFMKYNTATDSWHNLTNLPAARAHLGLAAVDGKVYAIGGSNGNQSVNTTFEFDSATNTWTTKAPMPVQMESFGVAVVKDRIYTVGGWSTWLLCYPCGEVFEYDPANDTWSMKTGLPTPRAHLAATVLEDEIYAIGGDSYVALNAVEVYDPNAESWSTKANMNLPRSGLSAETLGANIYAYGGTDEWGISKDLNEMYDPSLDNWSARPSMLEPRVYFGSGAVGNCIYAMAGLYGPLIVGFPNSTEAYCLGGELEYAWDFDSSIDTDGDGNFTNDMDATGPTPTHVYYDDGVYIVTLKVTDASGQSDWDTCNITVLNVPPTPEWTSRSLDGTILNPPYPEGKEILFEATVYDPGIYDTFTYDWDFGDGTILLNGGPSVSHAYGDNDTHAVVLTVTDDDGGIGIDDTPPLLTTNEDPVASISIPRCPFFEGSHACPMDGFFVDPGWLDTHSAVWNFGDGEYETAAITEENEPPDATGTNFTTHQYGDDGIYNVTFTVIDDDGGVGTAQAGVSVYNLPPLITVDIPSSVSEGEQFNLGITVTDPGSDDLFINIDWGDGTSESEVYYNNGIGPDPPNSGPGIFPFTVHANFSHAYGDNGNFTIVVKVEDDDGGVTFNETIIVVENVPPTIEHFDYFFNVTFSLRIAGEKWHNVEVFIYEDGTEIGYAEVTRYPGNPDEQTVSTGYVKCDITGTITAMVLYTPEDDPINGQANGANPVWLILTFEDGTEERLKHTFNVQHADTWEWNVIINPYLGGHEITFEATTTDPGSDDLTFNWNWGDGSSDNETTYYNDGIGPDPYPSPGGTYPFTATNMQKHTFTTSGVYTVTLTVEDDDGGVASVIVTITIP